MTGTATQHADHELELIPQVSSAVKKRKDSTEAGLPPTPGGEIRSRISSSGFPSCQKCLQHVVVIDTACALISELLAKHEKGKLGILDNFNPILKHVYLQREQKLKEREIERKRKAEEEKKEAERLKELDKIKKAEEAKQRELDSKNPKSGTALVGAALMQQGQVLPPLKKDQFKGITANAKIKANLLVVEGVVHLGKIHDALPIPNSTDVRFCGDRYMATVNLEGNPPSIVEFKEVSVPVIKCFFYQDYELHFNLGKEPTMVKEGKPLVTFDHKLFEDNGRGIILTGDMLYFRENGRDLVRVNLMKAKELVASGGGTLKGDVIYNDVESFYAEGSRVYVMNRKGEVRGVVQAMIRLGPSVNIDSTSAIVPIGENLIAIWHSALSKRNNFVMFNRQLQTYNSLTGNVPDTDRFSFAVPYTTLRVNYVLAVRATFGVDLLAQFANKLYLIKAGADLTYGVDSAVGFVHSQIHNVWKVREEAFFIAAGDKWLKTIELKVGYSSFSAR